MIASDIYASLVPFDLQSLERRQGVAYIDKMMHRIPGTCAVDRVEFVLKKCVGRLVLNLGCASGSMHSKITAVARSVIGVDKMTPPTVGAWLNVDLDEHPSFDGIFPEIAVAGEILEHLANPGHLLKALRDLNCSVLITVPSAFSRSGQRWNAEGYEQVNNDHVAWYSYRTLKTLVERYGFAVKEFHWYGGRPLTAEGLIFLIE